MTMTHQIANQITIVGSLARPRPVGNARGLDDGAIITEIVNYPNEAFIEYRNRTYLLKRWDRCPSGRCLGLAKPLNLFGLR